MYWHVETDFICLIIMLIMNFDLRKRYVIISYRDKVFKLITAVTIICIAIDITASLAMDFANTRFIYQLFNIIYFASMPLLPLLWFYYACLAVEEKLNTAKKVLLAILCVLSAAFVLVAISNPITGLLFTLTKDMEYSRGPLFAGSIVLLVVFTVVTTVMMLANRKKVRPRSRVRLVIGFFVLLSVSVYFQLTNPGWLVIYGAYTIMFIIAYYFMQSVRISNDGLTGVLNRLIIEERVSRYLTSGKGRSAAFIIADLDNFKSINDTMGHTYGDIVLKSFADICRNTFADEAMVARLGGDEFVIFNTNYESDERLSRMIDNVNTALCNKFCGAVKVTASMGISLYPKDGNTFIELYESADAALYISKRSGRGRYKSYSPGMDGGKECESSSASDGIDMMIPQLKELLNYGSEYTGLDCLIKKKDGTYLWIRNSGKIIRGSDSEEQIKRLCTEVIDILTLRSQSELQTSTINEVSNAIQAGICAVSLDEKFTILFANAFYYQIFGYSSEEAKTSGFTGVMYTMVPEELARVRRIVRDNIEKSKYSFGFETEQRDKTGIYRTIDVACRYSEKSNVLISIIRTR